MKVFGYVLLGIVCVVIAGAIGIREELPTWFIVVFFSASFLGAVIKSATGIGNAFFLGSTSFRLSDSRRSCYDFTCIRHYLEPNTFSGYLKKFRTK